MTATLPHHSKQAARAEFERWAHTYDRSILQWLLFRPTFEHMLEEVARFRLESDAADRRLDVLDIGCGTGNWAAMLFATQIAGRVTGLDYSPEMCRRANAKAQSVGESGLTFINGDSEHLPFADASFDLLTCSHSFHHYPHQRAVVREMHRVLRPGGRLILVDGFRDNIVGWFVFDVFVTRAEGAVYHVPWSEMRGLFVDAGFADIRQRKFNIWAPALMTIGTVGPSA